MVRINILIIAEDDKIEQAMEQVKEKISSHPLPDWNNASSIDFIDHEKHIMGNFILHRNTFTWPYLADNPATSKPPVPEPPAA